MITFCMISNLTENSRFDIRVQAQNERTSVLLQEPAIFSIINLWHVQTRGWLTLEAKTQQKREIIFKQDRSQRELKTVKIKTQN